MGRAEKHEPQSAALEARFASHFADSARLKTDSAKLLSGPIARGGGKMAEHPAPGDVHVCVPHERSMRIQEVHLLVLHCLCDGIDTQLYGEKK